MQVEIEEKGGAHPDVSKNFSYYEKMIGKVEFIPEIKIEIQYDQMHIPLCVLIVHGPGPEEFSPEYEQEGNCSRRNGAFCLSFHQEHRMFRIEMCGALNNLGWRGMLRRIDNIKKIERSDWDRLFN